ncbi:MAG: dienelactone hydrolase family protein [Pseudomonadota bacterium]
MINFLRPDGAQGRGYLAQGQGSPAGPGVVLIQEWWGLNEHICGIADRLAAQGLTVLAPDLYRGRLASTSDEASHMMAGLDFGDATHQDIRGAAQHLAQHCSKVGVMGFCMGGALTIAAAVHVPELLAAVCFYGIPPKEVADPARIKIPFQGHFAKQDDWCTPKVVGALEKTMRAAGAQPEIFHYDAHHAFFNQTRPEVYDAACAQLAWGRSVAFLRKHLQAA